MRNIILFDDDKVRAALLPLTFTRPVAEIRFGIMTQTQKWQKAIEGRYSYLTQDYLSEKYPAVMAEDNLFVAAHVCPDGALVAAIEALGADEALVTPAGEMLARRGLADKKTVYDGEFLAFREVTDLFMLNDKAIRADYAVLVAGRKSAPLSDSCRLVGDPSQLFIEEGATVECANINVAKGPVYIGRDAEVMEGACLRGPIAMCPHSVVNMGGKIYGATTLGPYCKVGGELNNVVMTGYSNKAHDGFLGNAVIGEWCNLGAGCTASNLKNTYGPVRLWSYATGSFVKTGLQFCGLIMGDHTKAGINTMFNTATVVGVGCNIYGSGFPRNFVASFSEGGASGFDDVSLNKFFDIARRVMARRHVELTDTDVEIFKSIYEIAETYK